jgi:hypothetical protein
VALISQLRVVYLLFFAGLAQAQADGIAVLGRSVIEFKPGVAQPRHSLRLTLAHLEGSGWTAEEIAATAREGARLLEQCGVALERAELVRIAVPTKYLDFYTPFSRELASVVPLAKPAIYFVAGTRQRPAFDAEAIGFSNSRSRPELVDTVWITRASKDLAIVLAHELAHVLMDSGEHSILRHNLMNAETAPENILLSPDQCERLRQTAFRNGLLGPR